MATLLELFDLQGHNDLQHKVTVAGVLAAEAIRVEAAETPNNTARRAWAKDMIGNPRAHGQRLLWAVLAANASATVEQITAASDEAIKSAVANVVNLLA